MYAKIRPFIIKIMRFIQKNLESILFFLFLLIVYLLGIFIVCFGFSNKLTNEEYIAISRLYKEMRYVSSYLKSDFYIDVELKILDRTYIMEELKRDSLMYTLEVTTTAFELLNNNYDDKYVLKYLSRCKLNFTDFKNLESQEQIYYLLEGYFNNFSENTVKLDFLLADINEQTDIEMEILNKVELSRHIKWGCVIISFFVIYISVIKRREIIKIIKRIKFNKRKVKKV